PITIRFEIEALSLRLDFGGIAEHHFGKDATKAMVRYDQVLKTTLEPIFAAASRVKLRAEDASPVCGEWRPPTGHGAAHASGGRGIRGSAAFRIPAGSETAERRAPPRALETIVVADDLADTAEATIPPEAIAPSTPAKLAAAKRPPRIRSLAAKMLVSSL